MPDQHKAKHIVWTEQARTDVRGIERPIALQILKTPARYAMTGEGNTKQLQGFEPPLLRLRSQDHRVFFRDSYPKLKPRCSRATRSLAATVR